ncbi:F-box/FBD/LRR-repeat protein At1g13570-like [Tasmannia lanceolata]|uniref:F-box/FBD/LRR-repeat protein At1g13570-like n=1 Tax=Tasmannia lanceolata TaxID=3420 RepID=UPI004063D3B7
MESSNTLDFDEQFATGKTPEEFVRTVYRYLQLYNGNYVERFRLFFYPGHQYPTHVEKWIRFTTEKEVKELELDFCKRYYSFIQNGEVEFRKTFELPHFLFACDSLTLLHLSHCLFNLPSNFAGLTTLQSLCLKEVIITSDMLERVFLNCPLLERLTLNGCDGTLESIKASAPDLRLKSLTVVHCYTTFKLEIFAPNLQSFHFNGEFLEYSFKNIESLVDVIISPCELYCEFEFHRTRILSDLSHIKILTISNEVLWEMVDSYEAPEIIPITFHNLQELQLLMEDLTGIDYFFRDCIFPRLEKLFIELPKTPENCPMEEDEGAPAGPVKCVFDNLKTIKMSSFRGQKNEMLLVKFFLEKAIVLESLVLVVPENSIGNVNKDYSSASQSESLEMPLKLLHEELLLLPKASRKAQIVLCENPQDYNSLCPAHVKAHYTV